MVHRRNRAEDAFGKADEPSRSLLQHVLDVVAILEADGTLRYVSPGVESMLGHTPEEVTGTEVFDYVHPNEIERALQAFAETLVTSGVLPPLEFRARRADGTWRYVEVVRNNQLDNPSVSGIVINVRDITGRKEAEEARARLAAIVESSHYAIMSMTLTGTLNSWNPGAERLFGYLAEEIVGRHVSVLIPPERRGEVQVAVEKLEQGEKVDYLETVRVTKGGGGYTSP